MNLFGALRTVDGDVRVRDGQGVPEGRGDGRPGPADRGQGAAALPGRGDGSLSPWTVRPTPRHRPRRRLRRPVRPADRPPGARGARLLGDRPPRHPGVDDAGRPPAQGDHPLGRARSRSTPSGRRCSTPAIYELGVPILGICYGAQLLAQQLGGDGRRAPDAASTGAPRSRRTAHARRCSPTGPREPGRRVDEPRRLDHRGARRLRGHRVDARSAGGRARATPSGASTACSSTPRWRTPTAGQELLERFLFDVCGARPTVDPHQHHRVGGRRRAGPGRRRPGAVRPVGRRRLGRGRRARPPGRSATSSPVSSSTPA